jgi:hypothetical protein
MNTTDPSSTQPSSTQPGNAEPSSTTGLGSIEPVSAEPVSAEPVSAEPVDIERGDIEAAGAEPGNTEPGDSGSDRTGHTGWLGTGRLDGGGAARDRDWLPAGVPAAGEDCVPGDPPVPITVWRTPADPGSTHAPYGPGAAVSRAVAVRLVAVFTAPGDLVLDLTGEQRIAAIAAVSRRAAVTRTAATDGVGGARLAVTGWPPSKSADRADPVGWLAALRAVLAPGGCLVLVIAEGRLEWGQAVAAAAGAGLTYIQHLVAADVSVTGGTLAHRTHPRRPAEAGRGHLRIHQDLIVLRRSPRAARGRSDA